MSVREDGGPAFPNVGAHGHIIEPGMTIRDYFAGQWINGAVGNSFGMQCLAELSIDEDTARNLMAAMAYKMADAMIVARSRAAS